MKVFVRKNVKKYYPELATETFGITYDSGVKVTSARIPTDPVVLRDVEALIQDMRTITVVSASTYWVKKLVAIKKEVTWMALPYSDIFRRSSLSLQGVHIVPCDFELLPRAPSRTDVVFASLVVANADKAAVFVSGILRLRESIASKMLILFARVPRSASPTSCASAAWDAALTAYSEHKILRVDDSGVDAMIYIAFWSARTAPGLDGPNGRLSRIRAAAVTAVPLKAEPLLNRATLQAIIGTAYSQCAERIEHMSNDLPDVKNAVIPTISRREVSFPLMYRSWILMPTSREPRPNQDGEYVRGAVNSSPCCHWGQLKLLLAEMEFFNRLRDEGALDGRTVVYVGAATGEHTPLLVAMYPGVKQWLLFDGARYGETLRAAASQPPRKIELAEGKAGFVTDDTIRALAKRMADGGERVLYLNDMRLSNDNAAVHANMVQQARWGVHLRAEAMLLKMRFPFLEEDGSMAHRPARADLASVAPADDAALGKAARCAKGRYTYLDGETWHQMYAKRHSAEARLFVRPDAKGVYALKNHDVLAYEAEAWDFNNRVRVTSNQFSQPALDCLLPGHDRGPESLREFRICADYVGTGERDAVRLMFELERWLTAATGRDLLGCTLHTYENNEVGGAMVDGRTAARFVTPMLRDNMSAQMERIAVHAPKYFSAAEVTEMTASIRRALKELDAARSTRRPSGRRGAGDSDD